jgi:hypothetical protein
MIQSRPSVLRRCQYHSIPLSQQRTVVSLHPYLWVTDMWNQAYVTVNQSHLALRQRMRMLSSLRKRYSNQELILMKERIHGTSTPSILYFTKFNCRATRKIKQRSIYPLVRIYIFVSEENTNSFGTRNISIAITKYRGLHFLPSTVYCLFIFQKWYQIAQRNVLFQYQLQKCFNNENLFPHNICGIIISKMRY